VGLNLAESELLGVLFDLRIWLLILLASGLGTVAALTYYYAGLKGTEAVVERFPSVKPERWERVDLLYERHGSGLLFFSFIPLLGILLETGAGVSGIRLPTYVIWVFLGRIVRNILLVLLVSQGLRALWG
jgi:membrane protein DedA with SNARE-associated domain